MGLSRHDHRLNPIRARWRSLRAFLPYAVLASLCLAQLVYPTILGWILVLLVYVAGSVIYVYTLGADALRLARGQHPQVFLNAYDTAFFLFLVAVLVALTVIIALNRPVSAKASHDLAHE